MRHLVFSFILLFGLGSEVLAKPIKFLFKPKVSTFMLVAPSSRNLVSDWMEKNYFVNNDWEIPNLSVTRKAKKKKDVFTLSFKNPETNKLEEAYEIKVSKKKRKVYLRMKMKKGLIKHLQTFPDFQNISRKELKLLLQARMLEQLDDLKSYWGGL